MAALNLAGKTSGYVKLKSPDVALNATVELPNKDGILATLDDVGSGGGGSVEIVDAPAFRAELSELIQINKNVTLKLPFNTLAFDSDNAFDVTNHRYTPTVAGYYYFTLTCRFGEQDFSGARHGSIWKNGSEAEGVRVFRQGACPTGSSSHSGSALIYMNGTTDYVEFYVVYGGGVNPLNIESINGWTCASGVLVKPANSGTLVGGEPVTLESLGIPNHDKLIVKEDGDATINELTVGKGTGTYSTVLGRYALYADTGGTYNTAVGDYSQRTNTAGSYNTSLGGNALKDGDGYSYNTAVGYNALVNSSADANTALGFNAGSQITTGTNNTCIGNGVQPSSATTNHEITLGNASVTKLRCQVTTITGLSDSRDKKDIQAVPSAIDFIKKMKPVTFTWNMRDKSVIDKKAIGFIAQDLKQLQEESGLAEHLDMIIEREDGTLEASPMSTYPLLVKAVQELAEKTTIIDKLLAKVEALEEKLKKVK